MFKLKVKNSGTKLDERRKYFNGKPLLYRIRFAIKQLFDFYY